MKLEGASLKVRFFMQQVASLWNILPKDIIVANRLWESKIRPDTYLKKIYWGEKGWGSGEAGRGGKCRWKVLHMPVFQLSAIGRGQQGRWPFLWISAVVLSCIAYFFALYSCWVTQYTLAVCFWMDQVSYFLYTLMNKNWNYFKSSSSPLWGLPERPRRDFTSCLECLANHFVQSWWWWTQQLIFLRNRSSPFLCPVGNSWIKCSALQEKAREPDFNMKGFLLR